MSLKIKKFKFKLIFLFIILIFGIFIIYGIYLLFQYLDPSKNNSTVKCNMKYGLCPAAKCIPSPYDDSKAFCYCDVKTGNNYSVGNNDCNNIQPYTTKSGEEMIFSDFSPIITKLGYHLTKCTPEAVNLNCMNKICSIDPNNPSKAICICDKLDNNGLEWVTYNKNGAPKTCNYQSGASMQSHLNIDKFIKKNK